MSPGGQVGSLAIEYLTKLFTQPESYHNAKIQILKCSQVPTERTIVDILHTLKDNNALSPTGSDFL
jgi:hypothetical protein